MTNKPLLKLGPVSSRLLAAREHFAASPDNWIQGTTSNGRGGFCLTGYLSTRVKNSHLRYMVFSAIDYQCHSAIESWNDHPDRTRQEVCEMLERAALAEIGEGR